MWKQSAQSLQRFRLRYKHALPIVTELGQYLDELQLRTLPRAPLSAALSYALGQWADVARIFADDINERDNNTIERQIRPIAVERKDYLSAGSHVGAAAVLNSLLSTAKLICFNQFQWPTDVLPRQLRTGGSASDLLRQRWRETGV